MKRIYLYMAILLASTLVSCNERIIEPAGYGYLGVSLERDDDVILKSLEAPSDDMVFTIEVYRGEELVATCADHRTLDESPLKLPVDTYRVVATAGNVSAEAGFDMPVYSGETEVPVLPDRKNEAEIVASLANVKVTVEFDDALIEKFPSRSVTVNNGTGTGLTFSNESGTVGKTGYLKADGTLAWSLILTNSDGQKYVDNDVYTGVEARQYYRLKFVLAEEQTGNGKVAIKLIIDDSMEEKIYDLVLDFDNSSQPKIGTNDGFELTQHMYFTAGDNKAKVFSFTSDKGIGSLVIESNDGVMSKAASYRYELVDADASLIASLAAKGIRTSSVAYGAQSASVDVTDFVAGLPTGDYSLAFSVCDIKGHMTSADFTFTVMSDVDADILSATPWARFVIVEGKWFAQDAPAGLTFSYRKTSDATWTSIPENKLEYDVSTKTYTAVITSLEPETTYYVKAVSAEDQDTRHIEFTTETAGTIPNMNFEIWTQNSSTKLWYPNPTADDTSADFIWDSANTKVLTITLEVTTPETDFVAAAGGSKKAAKLNSKAVASQFAAGNLYTGNFGSASLSPLGATLEWGVPFSSRPIALKGYYFYIPQVIHKTKSPYGYLDGTMDVGQIQVILTDWAGPLKIDTTKDQYFKLDDPHVIAYGTIDLSASTGVDYEEFTIPIEYRDVTRTPTYAAIVCAASKYGDYYTGGENTILYLDEFSFEYDIANLTPEQASKVNYR